MGEDVGRFSAMRARGRAASHLAAAFRTSRISQACTGLSSSSSSLKIRIFNTSSRGCTYGRRAAAPATLAPHLLVREAQGTPPRIIAVQASRGAFRCPDARLFRWCDSELERGPGQLTAACDRPQLRLHPAPLPQSKCKMRCEVRGCQGAGRRYPGAPAGWPGGRTHAG